MNLKNNSPEMKTVVETFVVEETAPLIYDNEQLDKWNKHVEELGLTGQTKIVKAAKSPIPFMHLKQTTKEVLETLCPVKVDVQNYSISPIPVEILELIALSTREGYFDKLEIWYDDKNLDPACVGYIKHFGYGSRYEWKTKEEAEAALGQSINSWNYDIQYYLLGKWADVKASFEELKQRAIIRFKQTQEAFYKQQIKDYSRKLEDVDNECLSKFGPKQTNSNDELPF